MSLHDRYHRDEGRIQRMDRRFTEIGNKVGDSWLESTNLSRDILTKSLYLVAAAAATQHFLLYRSFGMLLIVVVAALCYRGIGGQSGGGIVEQIQSQAAGLPKNSIAFLRLFVLMLGLFSMVNGLTHLIASEMTANVLVSGILNEMLVGVALVSYQMSEYIRRTNSRTGSRGGRRPGKLVKSTVRS